MERSVQDKSSSSIIDRERGTLSSSSFPFHPLGENSQVSAEESSNRRVTSSSSAICTQIPNPSLEERGRDEEEREEISCSPPAPFLSSSLIDPHLAINILHSQTQQLRSRSRYNMEKRYERDVSKIDVSEESLSHSISNQLSSPLASLHSRLPSVRGDLLNSPPSSSFHTYRDASHASELEHLRRVMALDREDLAQDAGEEEGKAERQIREKREDRERRKIDEIALLLQMLNIPTRSDGQRQYLWVYIHPRRKRKDKTVYCEYKRESVDKEREKDDEVEKEKKERALSLPSKNVQGEVYPSPYTRDDRRGELHSSLSINKEERPREREEEQTEEEEKSISRRYLYDEGEDVAGASLQSREETTWGEGILVRLIERSCMHQSSKSRGEVLAEVFLRSRIEVFREYMNFLLSLLSFSGERRSRRAVEDHGGGNDVEFPVFLRVFLQRYQEKRVERCLYTGAKPYGVPLHREDEEEKGRTSFFSSSPASSLLSPFFFSSRSSPHARSSSGGRGEAEEVDIMHVGNSPAAGRRERDTSPVSTHKGRFSVSRRTLENLPDLFFRCLVLEKKRKLLEDDCIYSINWMRILHAKNESEVLENLISIVPASSTYRVDAPLVFPEVRMKNRETADYQTKKEEEEDADDADEEEEDESWDKSIDLRDIVEFTSRQRGGMRHRLLVSVEIDFLQVRRTKLELPVER